jgi:hypothetical protein
MKKIVLIALLSSFVIACGGGDDSNANAVIPANPELTKEQIEEKFNLPPEPDQEVNNVTIEGIDSNGIRGRDDVERAVTFKFYKDEVKLGHLYSLLEAERAVSITFQGQNETERQKALEEVSTINSCYIFSYRESGGIDLRKVDELLENTSERSWFSLQIRGEQRGSFKELIENCKKRGFTNMPI